MGIKIDMAKAFDRVDWVFLITIMKKLGFDDLWFNKIYQCISTNTSAVLINGSPDKFFKPSRGIRQDDCMIFCKANKIEAQNIMQLLQTFGNTSGQLINFHKSGVFFSKNTNPELIPQISNAMGVQVLQLDDKYLGSPFFTNRSKINSFKHGVEKLKPRLTGWKHTPLNPAGREVIIKSVTSSACIYQMNCFKVPKKTCKDINNLQRDFFWSKNIENPFCYYPKAWTAVCKPKALGGLGFMNMELFNNSMITKIVWRLEQDKDSLRYKLMDARYLIGRNVLSMNTKAKDGDSWIWKGILEEEADNTYAHYTWNAETGFGKHINICTIQDPENFVCYSALTMTDFAGNIIGSRGHPGNYGEEGVTGGVDLDL
ncbi:uncharacterized protein LOC113315432 [Papaver somniferum]|uniref:uncharacterized protein LOC113315432 n=1 Tax=Papaver somniferum TaxID=3469 RepID=UPI000E6F7293|nr:uncharacterized protein LOC113315432 [Papaver somniferum]